MISLETKVNGLLIGCAYIVNKGQVDNGDGPCVYSVEYYRMGKEPAILNFKVVHHSEDGFEKLSLIIYKKIDNILKNKRN